MNLTDHALPVTRRRTHGHDDRVPPCSDPDCFSPPSCRMISGARFGFDGSMHVACYNRRVALARKSSGIPPPRKSHKAATAEPGAPLACPGPDELDRMVPGELSRFVRKAWGTGWVAVALTAEPRRRGDVTAPVEDD